MRWFCNARYALVQVCLGTANNGDIKQAEPELETASRVVAQPTVTHANWQPILTQTFSHVLTGENSYF